MTSEDHRQLQPGCIAAAGTILIMIAVLRSPSERDTGLIYYLIYFLPIVAVILGLCCNLRCCCNNNTSRTRQNQYESIGQNDEDDSYSNNNAEIALVAIQCTDTNTVFPEAAATVLHGCASDSNTSRRRNNIPEVVAKEEVSDAHRNRNLDFFSIIDDHHDPVAKEL
eukprot:scaffold770_cov109-Cylindrotheca_fusiformis.AAC.1